MLILNKIQSVQYSRRIEWGYLGAAVVLGLLFGVGGLIINSRNAAGWGILLGLIFAVGFGIMFLASRKAKIRICAGDMEIEVTSDAKTVNELIAFIEKVQATIIERDPGPKAKAS